MDIIAHIHNDYTEKFGIPRQSGLVEGRSEIIFCPKYRTPDAFRGLEGYSHLWLLWEFSEAVREAWSPTVRPPRLGGNTRMGVFATRSPFRPNPIGLSCVGLERIEFTKDRGQLPALPRRKISCCRYVYRTNCFPKFRKKSRSVCAVCWHRIRVRDTRIHPDGFIR